MIRLELPKNIMDSGLSLPESTPKTLIQVEGESLPYACQCPLCGGLFDIPEGLLYKVEEDALLDGDLIDENDEGTDVNVDVNSSEPAGSVTGAADIPASTSTEGEVGENNDMFV